MAQNHSSDTTRLSQAYIVSAANEQLRLEKARQLAAAAVCSGEGKKPCGLCRDCRKAEASIHPDIIPLRRLLDDKGKPKKFFAVDQVREMAADAVVLPNEAGRKVYILEEAQHMNEQAQNAALKLLEEPPAWACFILCTPSAAVFLPTVRSRCTELGMAGERQAEDEECLKKAGEFLSRLAEGDRAKVFRFCTSCESMDSRQTLEFLDCTRSLLSDMLCRRKDSMGMDARRLTALMELCGRCTDYLRVNTGVKHIFGLLSVKAPEVGRNRG